jgi:parallel beta-helix repeat protein
MKRLAIIFTLTLLCVFGFAQSLGNYTFSYASGTYTEISGGTLLGSETTADQRFVDPAVPLGGTTVTGPGFPLGFNFYFCGQEFDRVGISADGWLGLGQSWEPVPINLSSSSYTSPLGTTSGISPAWLVSRVAGLALNLSAQTGSTLRIETLGTAPYRMFVAQWKGYRKNAASGDNYNYQIRLEETTNKVVLMYGIMNSNATATTAQVGMRGEPATSATNFANRTTTTDWSATTAGAAATNTCTLSNSVFPADGAMFTWTPPAAMSSVYTIGSGGDFTSFAAAINSLNADYASYGIPEGGITFNVAAGETFIQEEMLAAITATGFADRTITFRKSGTGTDPVIRAAGTTATTDAVFKLSGSDYLTFDHISIQNTASTTSMEYGFHLSAQSYNPCNHNTFTNCSITFSRTNTNTKAVYSQGASNAGNSYNTFNTITIADCYTGVYLYGYSTVNYHNDGETITGCVMTDIAYYGIYFDYSKNLEVSYNSVSMCAGNTVEFHGIHANSGSNTTTAEVSHNTVIGNTTSARVCGIYADSSTISWHHNTVRDFVGTGSAERIGFYAYDGNHNIYENEIYNISATSHVYGIAVSGYGDIVSIYNNEIHDIAYTGPVGSGYFSTGINVYGTNVTVANNMIYDLASTGDVAPMIRGIVTYTGGTFNIYYNTIYLKGGGTNTNFGSACIYLTNSGPTLDIRNNIMVDLSTPGTGTSGRATAIWKSYTGFANYASTCDRNIYYAGTPGSKNLICYDNGTSYQTLLDYKNAIGTMELGSLTENVPFVSTNDPYDIHIDPSTPTVAEGNALPISGWDFDFDNNNRSDTTPDIGADEGNFLVPAIVPDPVALISPSDAAIVVQPSATLNWAPGSTGGTPTGYLLYFGTNNPPTNIVNGMDLGNLTTYDPDPDMAFLTQYYWKIVPYNATGSANAALCPIWSFTTHAAPLTGNYIIGSTGYYPSFTLAITHLNAAGVGAGGVTYTAISGEVFAENPPIITASGTATDPIVFTSTDTLSTNPRITPTGGTDTYGIRIDGGDYITFHHIDVSNPTGLSNLTNGYWVTGSSSNPANYIAIRSCQITLSRTVTSTGVYMSGNGANTGLYVTGNTIDNAVRGVYVYPSVQVYSILVGNNIITNATEAGIYLRSDNNSQVFGNSVSFPTGATVTLTGIYLYNSNNSWAFDNVVCGGSTSGTCYGLACHGNTTYWHDNLVTNLHGNSGLEGFNLSDGTCHIYNNEFTALSSNNNVYGIEAYLELGGTAYIHHNLVHNLSSTTTSANYVQGIYTGGTNNKIYNNFVYDLRNPGGNTAPQVIGIQAYTGNNYLYDNTVYLDAAGSNVNFSTTGIHVNSANTLYMNNNIFINLSTPGSNGAVSAIRKSADGFANISASTDYNIYYAGTPSIQNLICRTPTVDYQTMDDYKAGTLTFDQNSLTEDVPLVGKTSPYDLHITPGAATLAESNGIQVTDVTDDIDGDIRWGETGYAGTGSAPDIGADEGEFQMPLLVPGPAVLVSPIDDAYAVSINPTFTWYASAAGGAPTGYIIYYFSIDPLVYYENGTDLGNVLTYTSSVTLDYLATYYWQIVPYNDNGSANPALCPVWSFSTHQAPLTGDWIIGSTGYYPDFTHAINYLNASGVGAGGVTFKAITGETFAENPPAIMATGTAADPVMFTSTDTLGVNPKITPVGGTETFGIKIEGGDFITFHHIDIANAVGSTNLNYGFWLRSMPSNGCTDNTIRNCSITLDRTSNSMGIRSDSASGMVNNRNSFSGNTITNTRSGIYLYDTSAAINPRILGNIITNVSSYGVYIRTSNGVEIADNQISMAAGNTLTFMGIYSYNDSGTGVIHNNMITGNTTSQYFYGIYHTYGGVQIYNNSISGVTSSTYIYGIANQYSGENLPVYGNVVTNLTSTGNSEVYGIQMGSSTVYQNTVNGLSSNGQVRGIGIITGSAYRNNVHDLQTNSTSNSVIGMYTNGNVTVHNNLIYDLRAPLSSALPGVRGVHAASGTQNHYYNSVLLTASGSHANTSSAVIYAQGSTTLSLNMQNNIFSNLSTPGSSGLTVGLWITDANFDDISSSSNNNIWYAGTPGSQNLICYYGAIGCQTLEDYKGANAGKDQNSFTEDAPFVSKVSPYDLHLDDETETYAEGNGLVVASVTVDYDGQTRDPSYPDIGADEGVFTEVQLPPAIPVYLSPSDGATDLALNIPIAWAAGSGGGTPDYYNVYFGTTTPPPLLAPGVASTSYYPAGMLPEHTYYWKIDAVNTLGTATGGIWSFSTRADDTIMEFPFTESFEEGNTSGSTTINRWTQALGGGSYYWTANTATSYNRAPRTGSFNVTLRDGGNAWLFRPIYLQEGRMYGLQLWARQYTASGAQAYLQVRLGTEPAIASMTQTVINIQEFVNGDYQSGTGTFTATSTGIWYLGIHGVCSTYINYLSLDDISIDYYEPHPVFNVSPESKNYGMVNVSESSASQEFVVTNTGDADLIILQSDIYLDGIDADHFVLTDPGSDLTILPGNSASIYVAFAPQSLGMKYANLVIVDNTTVRTTHQIPLSGRGIGPLIPPCLEDFEDGWIDWVRVNGEQTNKWELGTATSYRNSYSAYISSNNGATHSYNPNASSYVHIYHDVVFPTNMEGMKLKFEWKGIGEAGFDYFTVHITDNSFVPVAGEYFSEGQIGAYGSSAGWQLVTLPLSSAYAGQTKRLIFSWRNDGGGGTQPPAAVDNIRIFSVWPDLNTGIAPSGVSATDAGGIISLTWDKVSGANDYIIEDADMYNGTFSPIGFGYNVFSTPGNYPKRFFRVKATD